MLVRDGQKRTDRVVGLLDIGSTKVCCLIADLEAVRVLGIGYSRSRGVKAGLIVDLDEAEQAVRACVAQAERMAGVAIDRCYVAVDCGRMQSLLIAASAKVAGRLVDEADVQRVLAGAEQYAAAQGRLALQVTPLGYRLDGSAGVSDPRGMTGERLAADLNVVVADAAPVRNVALLVERCHLEPVGLVPASLASGLAASTEDERRTGIAVVDMGGGTTSIAAFADGRFLFTQTLPIGGNHVTYDLGRSLQTSLAEAERIKALYGTVVEAASDDHDVVTYTMESDGGLQACQSSRAQVRRVVAPRMTVMLGLVRDALAKPGATGIGRVVLTGGGSQLVGLGPFAAQVLGVPVRIGRAAAWGGVPATVCSPPFATALGLPPAIGMLQSDHGQRGMRGLSGTGYLGRVGQWLKQSF